MSVEEVFFEKKGSLGLITLNRPDALNALTLKMVREIHPKLKIWENDDEIKTVAVTAVGDRAFCAGGDIRALYDWGKSNDKKATGFYYEEYQLNQLIKSYSKHRSVRTDLLRRTILVYICFYNSIHTI